MYDLVRKQASLSKVANYGTPLPLKDHQLSAHAQHGEPLWKEISIEGRELREPLLRNA